MHIFLNCKEDVSQIPSESFGKTLITSMRKHDADKVALIDLKINKEITYKELLDLAIRLSGNLKKSGITKNDVIVLISQNNWQSIVILLSIFCVGAKLALLNPDYSEGELTHAFSLFKPKLIICMTNKILDQVQKIQENFDCIEQIYVMDRENENNCDGATNFDRLLTNTNVGVNLDSNLEYQPECIIDPSKEVALILLSSGTTGLPKGVMLTHANAAHNLWSCRDVYGIEKNAILMYLPFFHIYGAYLGLSSVFYGTKILIMKKFHPETFLQTIETYKSTTIFAVPSIVNFLAQSPLVDKYDTSSIRNVVCGTAPLSYEMQKEVEKRFQIRFVQQVYGLTETGGIVMRSKTDGKYGSIGQPVQGYQVQIWDVDRNQPLGPNQLGELRIRGCGIMKGYFGNVAATEAAFDGDGYLKTGDLGYYDDDNDFYVIDRIKDIIKYKSFQVSPAELENILINHPAVRDAAVIGKPDEKAGELPVACIAREANIDVTARELIDYVAERLSLQKQLHGGVIFVEEIPKTAGGKVLRRELRKIYLN